jgi:hypothetical protein
MMEDHTWWELMLTTFAYYVVAWPHLLINEQMVHRGTLPTYQQSASPKRRYAAK